MIMGIDPGWSGGVAVIDREGKATAKGFTKMTEGDISECLEEFAKVRFGDHHLDMCYIEKVWGMNRAGVKQATSGAFKFGHNYGFTRGCLRTLRIPLIEVSSMKWQTALSCRTGGDKNVTKAKAQQLYPSLKITHAIADALLIATYGYNEQKFLLN